MRKIETEKEYEKILDYVSDLMEKPSSKQNDDKLRHAVELIEEYEDVHYPIGDYNERN